MHESTTGKKKKNTMTMIMSDSKGKVKEKKKADASKKKKKRKAHTNEDKEDEELIHDNNSVGVHSANENDGKEGKDEDTRAERAHFQHKRIMKKYYTLVMKHEEWSEIHALLVGSKPSRREKHAPMLNFEKPFLLSENLEEGVTYVEGLLKHPNARTRAHQLDNLGVEEHSLAVVRTHHKDLCCSSNCEIQHNHFILT